MLKLGALALLAVGADARLKGSSQQLLAAKTSSSNSVAVSDLKNSLAEIQLRAKSTANDPDNVDAVWEVDNVTNELSVLAGMLPAIIDGLKQSHKSSYDGAHAFAADVNTLCEAPYGEKMAALGSKGDAARQRGDALGAEFEGVFGEGAGSLSQVFVSNSQALVNSEVARSGACCSANQKCPPDTPGVCQSYSLDKSVSCDFTQPDSSAETCASDLLTEYNRIVLSIASDAEEYGDSSLLCANGVVDEDEKARAFAQSMADMHLSTIYLAGERSALSTDLTDIAVDIEAAWAEYSECYEHLDHDFHEAMERNLAHDYGDDTGLEAVHGDWDTIHFIKCVLEALVDDIDSDAMVACHGAEVPEIDECRHHDGGDGGWGDGEGSGVISLDGGDFPAAAADGACPHAGQVRVNHQYDHPGQETCECVSPYNPCRTNMGNNGAHCILSPNCGVTGLTTGLLETSSMIASSTQRALAVASQPYEDNCDHIPTFPEMLEDPAEFLTAIRDGHAELQESTAALEEVGHFVESVVNAVNCEGGGDTSSSQYEAGCTPECLVNGVPVPSDTHLDFPPATEWEKHLALLNGEGGDDDDGSGCDPAEATQLLTGTLGSSSPDYPGTGCVAASCNGGQYAGEGGTGTGWGYPPTYLNYGEQGLVGHNWFGLTVDTYFDEDTYITGIKTDSNQPFTVSTSSDGTDWHAVAEIDAGVAGSDAIHSIGPLSASFIRMAWLDTHGTNGFHAQFVGMPTSQCGGGGGGNRQCEDPLAPRVGYWCGKVAQHFDVMTSSWATDPDGVHGCDAKGQSPNFYGIDAVTLSPTEEPNVLAYCKQWYPGTVSVKADYCTEDVTFMTEGNAVAYPQPALQSIQCVQGAPSTTCPDPLAPRVGYWCGKVAQHFDVNTSSWATDPDGVHGCDAKGPNNYGIDAVTLSPTEEANVLAYCKQWYPDTVSVKADYCTEDVTFMTEGNAVAYPQPALQSIQCV